MSSYIASLQGIQQELNAKSGDDLYELFDSARIYRDSFINTASGPLKSSYAITIDIADEPGEIAAVATILALKKYQYQKASASSITESTKAAFCALNSIRKKPSRDPQRFFAKRATVCTTGSRNPVPGSSHYTKRDHLQSDLFFLIFPLLFPSPHYFLHTDTYEQSKRTATGIQHHIRKTPIASWDK